MLPLKMLKGSLDVDGRPVAGSVPVATVLLLPHSWPILNNSVTSASERARV